MKKNISNFSEEDIKKEIPKFIQKEMEKKTPLLKLFTIEKAKHLETTKTPTVINNQNLYGKIKFSKIFILENSHSFDNNLLKTQLNRVKYDISNYYNKYLSMEILECLEMEVEGPTLSDWSATKSNIRQDNIKLYDSLNNNLDLPVTDVCLNKTQYMQLISHLANSNIPYNILECKVNGIRYHNLLEAIPSNKYIAFNNSIFIGSVYLYIKCDVKEDNRSKYVDIYTNLRIKNIYLEAPIIHGCFLKN